MMDNKRDLASAVYIFLYKKNSVGAVKHEIMQNNELAEELHKSIIRKFEKWKAQSSFIENICYADLADVQF